MTMKPLTIGQVAHRSGVGIETVRFYEREGLLVKPERTVSGYRQFDEEVIARLLFIQRAKELGFTLNEIKKLLSLQVDPDMSCDDWKASAEIKIADIEDKIRTLQQMKKALVRLTQECCEKGGGSECPILDALDGHPRSSRKEHEPKEMAVVRSAGPASGGRWWAGLCKLAGPLLRLAHHRRNSALREVLPAQREQVTLNGDERPDAHAPQIL